MANTIPIGWQTKNIEELTNSFGGTTPSTIEPKYWDDGTILWASPTDITSLKSKYISDTKSKITEIAFNKTSLRLLDAGDILMTSRATVGYPAIAAAPICTNQGFINIKCGKQIENLFLYYWIIQNRQFIKRYGQGSTFLELNKKDFRKLNILLPPLSEQLRIAEILSTVDESIEKTDSIIEETRQLKKGLMQKLFTEGIGHTRFKETKIGRIPKEWDVVSLIDTAKKERYSFTGGPFGSNLKSEEYTETGVRIIQLQNIGVGRFLNKYKIYTSNEKADELKSCNIYPGDIIIAKMAAPVARACLMPNDDERYLMASDGIRLSVDEEHYDRNFILFSINSTYFNNDAERHSTGTTRLRIGLSELKQLLFKMPPLSEQRQIAKILSEVDAKIEKEEATKAELEQLKKGLMQVLLTGKVRVKA
jgi:type I restriction enzyme S subunit